MTTRVRQDLQTNQKVVVMQQFYNRLLLAAKLGVDTYSGVRDVYQTLGYPKELTFENYWSRYNRQDIAKAIIDRPVDASWKGNIQVIETTKDEETPFEKAWNELYTRLKLKSVFVRSDKLTGLGQYSILLLGFSDVTDSSKWATPVSVDKKKKLQLLYVKPLSEVNAAISKVDQDTKSERYGLPLEYTLTVANGNVSASMSVHYTRVIHFVQGTLEDEVYGTPRLKSVYNRLIDLEKLVGGDAEMFWRGARPGYTGEVNADYQMSDEMKKDLINQINEFENNFRRILVNEGVTYKALEQQIADPTPHVEVQIQMISADTGIPKRILTGSERGELSSAQDKIEWMSYVNHRREGVNETLILRPFIDNMINIGILPMPKDNKYIVIWDELFSLTELERIEFAIKQSIIIEKYSNSAISEYIPLDLYLKHFLNFTDTQIEQITSNRQRALDEEEEFTKEEEQIIENENNVNNKGINE